MPGIKFDMRSGTDAQVDIAKFLPTSGVDHAKEVGWNSMHEMLSEPQELQAKITVCKVFQVKTASRGITALKSHEALLSPRVRWHQVVCTIVDHKLAIVLAAVLDSKRPDGGVVGHAVAEEFRCFVQPCVTLLLNHFCSIGDGFLRELDHVGLGLEKVTRWIVALAEVRPEV